MSTLSLSKCHCSTSPPSQDGSVIRYDQSEDERKWVGPGGIRIRDHGGDALISFLGMSKIFQDSKKFCAPAGVRIHDHRGEGAIWGTQIKIIPNDRISNYTGNQTWNKRI